MQFTDITEGVIPMSTRCEDFPCCGHELGDCDGSLYGSDESIMSDPHLLCDHNTGYCEVEAQYDDDDDDDWEPLDEEDDSWYRQV